MANELQEKLDAILEDKQANLLPENLKKGITLLGVEGSLEEGSGGPLTQEEYNTCNQLVQDILNTNYIELEYIESSGTQFIDTGFDIHANYETYRIEAEMQLVKFGSSDTHAIIGTGNYYMGWRSDMNVVTFAPAAESMPTNITIDYNKHTFSMDAITKKYNRASYKNLKGE